MKRLHQFWIVAAACAVFALGGCVGQGDGDQTESSPDAASETEATDDAAAQDADSAEDSDSAEDGNSTEGASTSGYAALPTDGSHEAAAIAAIPGLLDWAEEMLVASGQTMPDLTGLEPTMYAYVIDAETSTSTAIVEALPDGSVFNAFWYPTPFDVANVTWTDNAWDTAPTTEPAGPNETAALEAARTVVSAAFPDEDLTFTVRGYRFVYLDDAQPVLFIDVAADSQIISVSTTG